MNPLFALNVLFTLAVSVRGATYTRTSCLVGQSFMDAFEWKAISDPTHGDVNYVDETTARAESLYLVAPDCVILRADDTTVLNRTSRGRNSFRLQSVDQFTTHVAIFDIVHMPEGCGTWPAICGSTVSGYGVNLFNFVAGFVIILSVLVAVEQYGRIVSLAIGSLATIGQITFSLVEYPAQAPLMIALQGEIDIVEGVNDQSPNQSTLHTGANCRMPATRTMTGKSLGTDCDVYDKNNAGCGVALADDKSFGPNFNKNDGGWYAIERSPTYIAIYFWERGSLTVPLQVSHPGNTIDTSNWGEPAAYFPSMDCNFSTHLGPHKIIINLTFCGDWAGRTYAASGCPSTCANFVNKNPGAFRSAYFEFRGLNIYE